MNVIYPVELIFMPVFRLPFMDFPPLYHSKLITFDIDYGHPAAPSVTRMQCSRFNGKTSWFFGSLYMLDLTQPLPPLTFKLQQEISPHNFLIVWKRSEAVDLLTVYIMYPEC